MNMKRSSLIGLIFLVSQVMIWSARADQDSLNEDVAPMIQTLVETLEKKDFANMESAIANCEWAVGRMNERYAGMKAETVKGKMSVADVQKFCDEAKKSNTPPETMGCGIADIDIKGEGSGSNWSAHTFHPASMGGEYTQKVPPIFNPMPCEKMAKVSNLSGEVKKYEGALKKLCGPGAIVVSGHSFSSEKIGPNRYKRTALVHCHVKRKAAWASGKVQFQ